MARSKLTAKQKEARALRMSEEHKAWSNAVRGRDKFTCQLCGGKPKRRKSIHAHHIVPFAEDASLRFDVNNGVTLCRMCHRRVHREKLHVGLPMHAKGRSENA
ncbi:HNH endonuclease [Candidatus Dependentiae bacterium]|nr:MAG: HNH endonuclease [Candidatus Dependentiae bacterium]